MALKAAGGVTPDYLAPAIIARYGKDRTFSVPILTHCALPAKGAGRMSSSCRSSWPRCRATGLPRYACQW